MISICTSCAVPHHLFGSVEGIQFIGSYAYPCSLSYPLLPPQSTTATEIVCTNPSHSLHSQVPTLTPRWALLPNNKNNNDDDSNNDNTTKWTTTAWEYIALYRNSLTNINFQHYKLWLNWRSSMELVNWTYVPEPSHQAPLLAHPLVGRLLPFVAQASRERSLPNFIKENIA